MDHILLSQYIKTWIAGKSNKEYENINRTLPVNQFKSLQNKILVEIRN